jgi:glycosyltransferase involved in cell wall biosynthesis
MRVLVLSFYFQPDLCAGSFRCTALIDHLRKNSSIEIDIVTTQPNRYGSFDAKAPEYESQGNVNIHRVSLPSHNSGMLDQIRSFTYFYLAAKKIVASKNYDMVFATSSRLFTAYLGATIAKKKKIPLYLDVRDIFVDTMNNVLSKKLSTFTLPVLKLIERYTFNSAKRINLVSKGFSEYFEKSYPKPEYRWYTNGIDQEFLSVLPTDNVIESNARLKLVYAGNIGEGQGLHTIIPDLAVLSEASIDIVILGDGGKKKELEDKLAKKGCNNVTLLPPVNREELIAFYQKADVLFLHLNDYDAFKKVLPSKIFEYAALGKPILAGVSGYAESFIYSEVENAEVFSPGDAGEALRKIQALAIQNTKREVFIEKYSRHNIMSEMSRDITQFLREAMGKKI